MDSQKPPKNIEESTLYTKNKTNISQDARLLDDALEGTIFVIASNPEVFPLSNEEFDIRVVKSHLTTKLPFTIYFKVLQEKIILLDIEITPED